MPWLDQEACFVISATRAGASRAAVVVEAPVLFDKWFEERETQAAESWRTRGACQRSMGRKETLANFCVSSHHHGAWNSGSPGFYASRVKVPVTQ